MMRSISLLLDVRIVIFAMNAHPSLTRIAVYRPNLKTKSDADILRDAKLEAMGLPPEEHEHRRPSERSQMATDEMVRRS